jgi:hypothetical protein
VFSTVNGRSAAWPQPKEQTQTNKPIATKNAKRALRAFGHQASAYRRCGLLVCKIMFCRKRVRGAYKRPGDIRMRGGVFCVFYGNWFVGLSKSCHREIVRKKTIFEVGGTNVTRESFFW